MSRTYIAPHLVEQPPGWRLYRYEIVDAWGQLPDGIAVGVVLAELRDFGRTRYHYIEGVEDGVIVAAWTARLIA